MPSSSGHRRQAGLLLPLLVFACTQSNLEPENARPLEPPPSYHSWWAEVEGCTGISAPLARVRWYEAERLINREAGTEHVGAWSPPHTIFIRSDRLLFEAGVKHEMVHDLLQVMEHDSPVFVRCAGM
ncbi:MAG: hypothetical protein HKM89_02970 [Gemmatimonadales bacterium]|nr:hypothetical protein [Gemmatimonadales bacterium]